jgi:hypothetical protein
MQAKLEENIRINNGKPFIFQHFTGISILPEKGESQERKGFAKFFSCFEAPASPYSFMLQR